MTIQTYFQGCLTRIATINLAILMDRIYNLIYKTRMKEADISIKTKQLPIKQREI